MTLARHTWALILAAGDGSRLRSLTTKPCGTAVPKQFCSLHGGLTLLEEAVTRANALTSTDKIVTIVAEQHHEWWSEQLARLPKENIVSQPCNRGTAIGILYPLLHILRRDPEANIVLLPADHFVREEFVLRQSLRLALRQLDTQPAPILLGVQPEESDSELGYIVPGESDAIGSRIVARFVEKPAATAARDLVEQGGLWNTFIMAATGQSLLRIFTRRYPEIVMELQGILEHNLNHPLSTATRDSYHRLPNLDFSRDVLERHTAELRVLRVPACGWSDLGTPRRVAETLRRIRLDDHRDAPTIRSTGHINLALQHARLERLANARYGEGRVA